MAADTTTSPAPATGVPADVAALVDDAVALAQEWLAATESGQTDAERATTGQLAALVGDPAGLDLAVRFVDRVARPEDTAVAARELAAISSAAAAGFLSTTDRLLLGVGARVAPLAPGVVVPLARRRLRQLVGHLVVDAHDPALARHLARARAEGFRLNINLLGEAVLGEAEAAARAARTRDLLRRDDVDYVSIKVSSLVSQISTWDTAGTVERVLERLRPIYRAAADRSPHAFVNLDMEEYRDLDLTLDVFERILAEPEFTDLEAGIVLQAYLPDSLAALDRLVAFAQARTAAGGAGIKVRFVKGANLSMEHVEAELHGWAPAPYATKDEVDANYLRLVERALRPELTGAVRIGVASHNLYDVALAHLLAQARGVGAALDVEMLQGMAPSQARAVRDAVGSVLLYTPVVAPADFDVAVSYLVRRLEENAQSQNFLHALFGGGPAAMSEQEARFRASVAALPTVPAGPRRTPDHAPAGDTFTNATDSDPALPAVRTWAVERVRATPAPPASPVLAGPADVDAVVATAVHAQPGWAARPPAERAAVLRRAADELEARRGELVTAMAAEGGKTVAEADPEVSEAIDFARYYADRALELQPGHLATDGATFTSDRVVLVTPPWNFPVAIPTGGVLATLAAGSAVIIKPAPAVPGCTEVAMAALHAAGVPTDVLQVVRTDEGTTGRALVAHPDVDAVVLTGAAETAELFASWRTGRPGGPRVLGETSGKNALVITPAADYDLAVADLVRSAFGHAGQKCSAASLAILVGSAGTSPRLRRQLIDAVSSLRVAWPDDLGAMMGPVIHPPEGKLARALTTLEPGETWLVEPRPLDDTGRLWSPGLKDGVAPGSFFHRTECFGPVLGLMRARTLDEAIDLQNATDYGLTGGLHSLDEAEIDHWQERVAVGNAYVNRHITGAIVRRQSFGGWKASVVGPGAKAGGPNYVAQLGHWRPDGEPTRRADPGPELSAALADLAPLLPDDGDRAWLRAAVGSDALAWAEELGVEHDESGLAVEANVFRYRPAPLTVRTVPGARAAELFRVLLAAQRAGTPVRVSLDLATSAALKALDGPATRAGLRRLAGVVDRGEDDAAFVRRVRAAAVDRIRVVGEGSAADRLADELTSARTTVLTGPVLATGRREMLTVLREQAISRTLHRFGHLPAER
ncbi:bifunctional proline dehydrogenase/L-glutamate gamma-semialdehyde dehydrogenase [Georgenia sp. TF02-10]|uniref:bifunctional proline dehydrogenase/L-glutamate gamma-semialdehyde dehydrogenase n=1 Tax=Georgenia sp. TF02-10 TaxID=2917725 RepID=UPI001FA73E7C|nr:bifunctional proline dehydrogenase/L-glutamate gamma-semialdehyde dehydrogenase [Georgenia sp. TF02-10]UNX54905.1 bifunctional proline dehydrogenase/L-glutamate gamma-semialdehyde dehydrogenase [Georgenia sp. TF02-10]